MPKKTKVLAMVMAGGKGERLFPLTKYRAKPAVPFGGKYRIIDFVLSNLVNSDICSIYVLTQFKSQSLFQHLIDGWRIGGFLKEEFIIPVPAQMRLGDRWYKGTADAIYQNIHLIVRFEPDIVAVFGADHIYRMNIKQMLEFHLDKKADLTISAIPVEIEKASSFGVIEIDKNNKVIGFEEKPKNPKPTPNNPNFSLVSMGNYLFKTDVLIKELCEDAKKDTEHDFGKNIIPNMFKRYEVYAYDFSKNEVPGVSNPKEKSYWRDVGTIQAYWEANMDLRSENPIFNLYNKEWPLRTASYGDPPARFILDDTHNHRGYIINSLVSEGSIIKSAEIKDSILGRNVIVSPKAKIENSIIMDNVKIGENCKIKNTIIDKFVNIPNNSKIGYDEEEDRKRGYHIDKSKIVVVPRKWMSLEIK